MTNLIGAPGTPTPAFGATAGLLGVSFVAASPVVGGQTHTSMVFTNTASCDNMVSITSGQTLRGPIFTSASLCTSWWVTIAANRQGERIGWLT
jgi:hypothetical protein